MAISSPPLFQLRPCIVTFKVGYKRVRWVLNIAWTRGADGCESPFPLPPPYF